LKRKLEQEEAETNMKMMKAVTEALTTKKSAVTGDDLFCGQIAEHLKDVPDGLEKERLKMKILTQIVEFKYNI